MQRELLGKVSEAAVTAPGMPRVPGCERADAAGWQLDQAIAAVEHAAPPGLVLGTGTRWLSPASSDTPGEPELRLDLQLVSGVAGGAGRSATKVIRLSLGLRAWSPTPGTGARAAARAAELLVDQATDRAYDVEIHPLALPRAAGLPTCVLEDALDARQWSLT